MKRRILTGLLACCLSLSLALPGFAAGAIPSPGEVSQVVTALGILDGNSSGSLELSRNVTRAEFITMALKASPNGDQVGEASTSPYPDVPYTHWAAGYVEAAVAAGLPGWRPPTPTVPSARTIPSPWRRGPPSPWGCWATQRRTTPGPTPPPSWPCTGARGWTRGCPPSGRRTTSPGRTPCTSFII